MLFEWVELLRERWAEALAQAAEDDALREKEASAAERAAALAAAAAEQLRLEEPAAAAAVPRRAPASAEEEALQAAIAEVEEQLVHGEPFVEKRSTFQAHLAPATRLAHVHAAMEILMRSNKIRAASHNMMAYRIQLAEGSFLQVRARGRLLQSSTSMLDPSVLGAVGLWEGWLDGRMAPPPASGAAPVAVIQVPAPLLLAAQDCDDDGESAAGGRMLHLLQMVDARNVVVVVSRWYGGILLGPARFTHINNAARDLLNECGYIAAKPGAGEGKAKGKAARRKGG